jgi:putative ABC transport system ATP-binding protein
VNTRVFKHRKSKLKQFDEVIVECTGLSKSYNLQGGGEPVVALRSITLRNETKYAPIRRGEFVVIRGPSGGGKTTFLNLVGTIDVATAGHISTSISTQEFRTTK